MAYEGLFAETVLMRGPGAKIDGMSTSPSLLTDRLHDRAV